jgi:hypothetical protein
VDWAWLSLTMGYDGYDTARRLVLILVSCD